MLKENNYTVLSGVELMMTVFPEQEFCVQDLVPKGLVFLTGEDLEPVRTMAISVCGPRLTASTAGRSWKRNRLWDFGIN